MNDSEIRKEVKKFFQKVDPECVIRHELNVDTARLDMMILVNDLIVGVEIKGDHDTYERIYNQLINYMSVCDRIYVATAKKELPADIPFFFGHLAIRDEKCVEIRKASPIKSSINKREIAKEVIENTLKESGMPKIYAEKLEELLFNLHTAQRTLFINETFARYADSGNNLKYRKFDNRLILSKYLKGVPDIQGMFRIRKDDNGVRSDVLTQARRLEEEVARSSSEFIKTIRNIKESYLRFL